MSEPTLTPALSQTERQKSQLQTMPRQREVFIHALLFVLGFSLIFTVGWDGAVTVFGQLFGPHKFLLGRIGGLIVILFGLATLDIIKIPWSMPTRAPNTRISAELTVARLSWAFSSRRVGVRTSGRLSVRF